MSGQYVFLMQKSWTLYMYTLSKYYFQRLSLFVPWNEYAYYFGRYPDSVKNGGGLHRISRRGQYAFLTSKSRILYMYAFSTVHFCFGLFSFLFSWNYNACYIGRYPLMQTRMWICSLTFPDMGSMRCPYVIILWKLINVLMFFLIWIIMCCYSASSFLEMIIFISSKCKK